MTLIAGGSTGRSILLAVIWCTWGIPIAGRAEFGDLKFEIQSPDPFFFDEFGKAVAFADDDLLIGAPFDDATATDAGTAYLYDSLSGALLHTFGAPGMSEGDYFGQALGYYPGQIVIGSAGTTIDARDAGAIRTYDPFQQERTPRAHPVTRRTDKDSGRSRGDGGPEPIAPQGRGVADSLQEFVPEPSSLPLAAGVAWALAAMCRLGPVPCAPREAFPPRGSDR